MTKILMIGLLSLTLLACGSTKETMEPKKDYETTAAEFGCDCVNATKKSLIEVGNSCLAEGMTKANLRLYDDENVMPYSGIPDMQTGIKLIQSKMIESCNN